MAVVVAAVLAAVWLRVRVLCLLRSLRAASPLAAAVVAAVVVAAVWLRLRVLCPLKLVAWRPPAAALLLWRLAFPLPLVLRPERGCHSSLPSLERTTTATGLLGCLLLRGWCRLALPSRSTS